jgi:hypothetical protein
MEFDLSPITRNAPLHSWIGTGEWIPLFDVATLNRAKPYSSEKLIRNLKIEGANPTTIRCEVLGTSVTPYRLSIALSVTSPEKWSMQTRCSCPVSFQCKHAAALLIMLARIFAGGGGMGNFVPPEISGWLAKIKKSAAAREPGASSAKPKAENRFLAYCIEDDGVDGGLHFVLRLGTRRKDGGFTISDGRANADLSNPPKYIVDQDIPLVSAFHALVRKHRQWGDLPLSGEGWRYLLEGAAAMDRLFYGEPIESDRVGYRYRLEMKYNTLTAGPEEWFFPDWMEMNGGDMVPVLKGARAGINVLPILPMMYLDQENFTLGRVRGDMPDEMMLAWDDGPIIRKEHLDEVAKQFGEFTGAKLPPPKKLKTVEHPATAPAACLKIGRENGGFLGKLLVRYGDSPGMEALATAGVISYSQLIGGSRHVWSRDGGAELAFRRTLTEMGFVPVTSGFLITGKVLGESDAEPPEDLLRQQMLWGRFLESDTITRLRDEGWEIEVGEKERLTVHDVADFFPEIEGDTDHGVDWFRFDVPHEINGKRVSLIPIIAQAIRDGLPAADDPELPEHLLVPCEDPAQGMLRFPARRLIEIVDQVRHLFHGREGENGPLRLDRLAAAGVADGLSIDGTATLRALAQLGKNLRTLTSLPEVNVPKKLKAELRGYQEEGFRWLQFLAGNGLHGILADDMGLGKTVQTLAHLAAEREKKPGRPSLVIAPTSVVPNWAAEVEKFAPHLKTVLLHGKDRAALFSKIAKADLVLTSYPLLIQDFEILKAQDWHTLVLDEAQYIKNPQALTAKNACKLNAAHRVCLSGTPMENHLGELWSLMRFLMPGFLADEKTFNSNLRRPIERDRSTEAQLALNRRVAPLILRRTKNEVASDLPEKTEIVHGIELSGKQTDLYESVRAAMDKRVRDAISEKGLAKSHIIVLDALLKLRQICCHPQLLKIPAARMVQESAKLEFLTQELLPTLIEEGRRILLFSTFTSMLAIIEAYLKTHGIPYLIITGQTQERASLVKKFQTGEVPVFLISLKAGGTGLNLTAADTVIHYDPWWNPAAENQATDRAHRIGQKKPVFVHKLVCRGSIEERMLELQKHKSGLVEALLSEETSKLKIDPETLGHLLAPIQ